MQKLHEMAVFSRVVATGSLSSAAREPGLSPALVSRRIAALEARLGVRLLHRPTRSLRLTDEGASYLDTCSRVLAEIAEADAAVGAGRVEPQGALKVAIPASFGNRHIAPLIPAFAARYPKVRSEEHTSELQSRLHLVCRLLLEKKNRSFIRKR